MIMLSVALLVAVADPAKKPTTEDAQEVADACGGELYPEDIPKMTKAQVTAKLACFTREAAKKFNKGLPSKVDDSTTLTSVSANGVTLTYHYKVNLLREDLKPGALEAFKPGVKARVCNAEDMRSIIDTGGSYAYEWIDRNGRLIGRLLVDAC